MAGIVVPLLSPMIGEAIFGVIGGDQSTKDHRKPSVLSRARPDGPEANLHSKCIQANDDVNTRLHNDQWSETVVSIIFVQGDL